MRRYVFGYDLPLEGRTDIHGEFEECEGMSTAAALEICRDFSILENSNLDKKFIEKRKLKGLRLLFLVLVDDEARKIDTVFPVIPDERLQCEINAVRLRISNENEAMKGTNNND